MVVISRTDNETYYYTDGKVLDACDVSAIGFDDQSPEFVIVQKKSIAPLCTVNVTAPAGFNIDVSVLAASNNVAPSYLYVEKLGTCYDAVCYDDR